MKKQRIRIVLQAVGWLAVAATASAHYTWLAPAGGRFDVGQEAVIRLCHGHSFPAGEEKLNIAHSQTTALTPKGATIQLTAIETGQAVTASYTPREPGLHRLVYVQDRGVLSRTPNGVRPGGRDANPDAAQSFRSYRSAIAYIPAGPKTTGAATRAGIEVELVGTVRKSSWELQLLRNGKPEPGAAIEVILAGQDSATAIGTTDAAGKVTYNPSGPARPMLFTTEWKAAPPAGAAYDAIQYSTSLYVTR